jgi:hypothetical protein
MKKVTALVCVISWSGFWAFGHLALSADLQDASHMVIAGCLAFAGVLAWMFTDMRLARGLPAMRRER